MRFKALLLAAALATALPLTVQAKTFRWSRSVDIPSWDIHAQNVGVNNTMHGAVYDTLVEYNSKTFKPEPSLATEWKLIKPTQLRLTLRKGVKFSDGSEFTADDAKFSLERAKAKSSNFAVYTQGIDRVEKVDAYTIDIHSDLPNPVLVNQLTELRIMSKAWAEKNKSVRAQGHQDQGRNLCPPQRAGHRPLPAQAVDARPARGAGAQPALVGQGQVPHQPDRDRLHPHQGRCHTHCGAALG